jgi:hypothetical protein
MRLSHCKCRSPSMLEVRCPVARLGMPPLRQLIRCLRLQGHSPYRLTAVSADHTRGPQQREFERTSRYALNDWCVTLEVQKPAHAENVAAAVDERGPHVFVQGATNAVRFATTILPDARPSPQEAAVTYAALHTSSLIADGIDNMMTALVGESAEHLALCHAALLHRMQQLDRDCQANHVPLSNPRGLHRALLVPQVNFLAAECGMPLSPYGFLNAALNVEECDELKVAEQQVRAYCLEFHGVTPTQLNHQLGDGGMAAEHDGALSDVALVRNRDGADEPLFTLIHKLLRARQSGPGRSSRRVATTGTAEVTDPLRSRARQSGSFGHQGGRGTVHVPWNVGR